MPSNYLSLKEVNDLLEKNPDENYENLMVGSLQLLLIKQCIYSDGVGIQKNFKFLRDNQLFVKKYFSALGYEAQFDDRYGMITLIPSSIKEQLSDRFIKIKKDQTIVLLTLRKLLDDAMRRGDVDPNTGRTGLDTDEFHDTLSTLSGKVIISESRLSEILTEFNSRGIVKLGKMVKEEHCQDIEILPGIRHLVPDDFIKAIQSFVEEKKESSEQNLFIDVHQAISERNNYQQKETEINEPDPDESDPDESDPDDSDPDDSDPDDSDPDDSDFDDSDFDEPEDKTNQRVQFKITNNFF